MKKVPLILLWFLVLSGVPRCDAQSDGLSLGPPMPTRTPPPPLTDPRNPFYRPPSNAASAPAAAAPVPTAAAFLNFSWDVGFRTIEGLPLYSGRQGDCDVLKGPMNAVVGEKLEWGYSFPWAGRGDDGKTVPLAQGDVVTFLGIAGNNLRFSSAGSPGSLIRPPPNVSLGKILTLAHLKLADCSTVILTNRIGQPALIRNGSTPGEKVMVYNSGPQVATSTQPETAERTEYNVFTGERTRVFYRVQRAVRADYTAYFFEVHCDASGKVIDVVDHLKGQVIEYRLQ